MIAMCINCGWLGTNKDLGFMPIKSDNFQVIIEINNMHMKVCPRCKETEICYKTECDNLYSIKTDSEIKQTHYGLPVADVMSDIAKVVEEHSEPKEEINTGIDDILSVAKSNITVANIRDGKLEIPRVQLKKQECDICKKEFVAKFETSRCDDCYDKLMDKMQVDIDEENKKAKKKIDKKTAKAHKKSMKTKKKKKVS